MTQVWIPLKELRLRNNRTFKVTEEPKGTRELTTGTPTGPLQRQRWEGPWLMWDNEALYFLPVGCAALKEIEKKKSEPSEDAEPEMDLDLVKLVRSEEKTLMIKWADITALDLSYAPPPRSQMTVIFEPKYLLRGTPFGPIHFLTVIISSEHMYLLEREFIQRNLVGKLKKGIPRWMVQRPYDHFYTRSFRTAFLFVSDILQLVLAACFAYQLYQSLPAWVGELQETFTAFLYNSFLAPGIDWAFAHPYISIPIGLGMAAFLWPLMMLWIVLLFGGALMLRYSFLLYVFITFIAYIPVVVKNVKRLAFAVPFVFNLFDSFKQKRQQRKEKKNQ
jgi:hypothetical protein